MLKKFIALAIVVALSITLFATVFANTPGQNRQFMNSADGWECRFDGECPAECTRIDTDDNWVSNAECRRLNCESLCRRSNVRRMNPRGNCRRI